MSASPPPTPPPPRHGHTLSRRDVEELRGGMEKAIDRYASKSKAAHSQILATASSCLTHGLDRRTVVHKLAAILDGNEAKATKLADRILRLAEEYKTAAAATPTKRLRDDHARSRGSSQPKKSKNDVAAPSDANGKFKEKRTNGAGGPRDDKTDDIIPSAPQEGVGTRMTMLSADKIRLMMVNAQQQIEERKRALSALRGETTEEKIVIPNPLGEHAPPVLIKPVLYSQPKTTVFSREDYEKQKRMAELQAKIQSKLSALNANPDRPRPLILDREGKTVDQLGRQVQLTQVLPTLKANIRAKKREELKAQIDGKNDAHEERAPWFDARVPPKSTLRNKKSLRFNEPGKYLQQAERIRMKAQLEKLQNEISQIARKTGISSATKLALLAPDHDEFEDIPEVEWWDSVVLMNREEREAASARRGSRASEIPPKILNMDDDRQLIASIKEDTIGNLVEHPTQLRPPCEPTKPIYMPVFLTKKERKKLRRQTRREAWKEEQEKVRLGLEAPAQPVLRISNLMRVLGSEAVQDPTKIEAHVREQMAKRKLAHEQANAARKLTAEQRSEKKAAKIKEDTSLGVHIGVYRVIDLFETASKKFKVEKNAQQLFMTGCVILYRGCCVIITEGGPKQHAKYKRLMLKRIKWEEDIVKDQDGREIVNKCELVWEGTNQHRHFGEIKFKVCPTERAAKEQLAKHGVQHYWDLAISKDILQTE